MVSTSRRLSGRHGNCARRSLGFLLREEVAGEQRQAARLREIDDGAEVVPTRKAFAAFVHANERRLIEANRKGDLFAGHSAADELLDGVHAADGNGPFQFLQRPVAGIFETHGYNLVRLNPCNGTMFV